jgi:hypothetical protein
LYGDQQLNALVEELNRATRPWRSPKPSTARPRRWCAAPRAFSRPGPERRQNRSSQGTGSSNSSLTSSSSGIRDTYTAQAGVSWEADVWGKLRRGLEANTANAEASFADLAAMRLSQQSELVQNYLQLRVIDEQKRLLEATVEAYQRSLKMTENQYRAGVSGKDAVAQAQTQLKSTEADLVDLIWQRAQFENAIAVLSVCRRPSSVWRKSTHPGIAASATEPAFAIAGTTPGHRLRRALGHGRQRQHRCGQGGLLPGPDAEPEWRLQQQHLLQLDQPA